MAKDCNIYSRNKYIGIYLGQCKIREQAIEAGVAQYGIDPKTGVTQFKWKSND